MNQRRWKAMKYNYKRIMTAGLAAVMLCTNGGGAMPVYGAEAAVDVDETMYVNLDYYGRPDKVNVVKGCSLNGKTEFTDYGTYLDVTNMSSQVAPVVGDGVVTWTLPEAQKERFYYKCAVDKGQVTLPWDFDVSYKLNGVPTDADQLAGASGLVEIHVKAEPNDRAREYYRNNLMLMVAVPVDMGKCYSVEAEGSQTQNLGETTAVVFTALPGEEGDYTVRIGTDSFETIGVIMAMMPGTVEDLEHIKDLKEAKDTWQDAGDELYDSLEQMAKSVEDMRQGVGQVRGSLNSAESARQKWSNSKDSILAGNDQTLASLTSVSQQLEKAIPHLQTAKDSAEVIHQSMGDIVNTMDDMQDPLRKLHTRLNNIKSSSEGISENIPELMELMQQMIALDAKLQASQYAYAMATTKTASSLALLDDDFDLDEMLETRRSHSRSDDVLPSGGGSGNSSTTDPTDETKDESKPDTDHTDSTDTDNKDNDKNQQESSSQQPSEETGTDTGNGQTDTGDGGSGNSGSGTDSDGNAGDGNENSSGNSGGNEDSGGSGNSSGNENSGGSGNSSEGSGTGSNENGSDDSGSNENGSDDGGSNDNGGTAGTDQGSEGTSGGAASGDAGITIGKNDIGFKGLSDGQENMLASMERHDVPLVTAASPAMTPNEFQNFLVAETQTMAKVSASSSQLATLMSNLMDDTSDSAKYSAEIVDNLDILIEDLTALHDSLDAYYPDLQAALDDSQELVSRTTDALNNGISTMSIVQNTLKASSDDFDAAARESIRGSMELLDKSLSVLDSTTAMRHAGRTMKDTIDNELDKFDTDNRFLFMDPSAEKVSFTSDQNRPPKTLQIIMRTDEISVDDDEAKTADAEVAKAQVSPLRRMWNVLVQMWKAMVSIFKNR